MSSIEHAIDVDGLNLSVPCFVHKDESRAGVVASLMAGFYSQVRREYRSVLVDVSFSLRDGDRLALLGRNGAGKTTLLHVLAGAYAPTSGAVSVRGQRQALLNISLGFNGDATVRENIVLRGTAIGMSFGQIRDQMSSILDFSELRGKADDRLNTLSAGQRLRLAFSVVTAKQPDILLLDEWISAGDVEFIRKAQKRLSDIVKDSRIFVLASHSLDLLKNVCNKGLVLDGGRAKFFGDIGDAIAAYSEIVDPSRLRPVQERVEVKSEPVAMTVRRSYRQGEIAGIQELSFPHHVLHENRVIANGVVTEHRLLVEIQELSVADAVLKELSGAASRGATLKSVDAVPGGHRVESFYSDGACEVMLFKHFDAAVGRHLSSGRGICHVSWIPGGLRENRAS